MKHRRLITSLLAASLLVTSIASCSKSSSDNTDGTDVGETTESVAESVTTESTESQLPDEEIPEYKYQLYATMTPEEIVADLTLEQKAAQMVQPAVYCVDEDAMRENDYGSILSTQGSIGAAEWRELVDGFQQAAIESEAGIPYVYGQDDVHGVNYCLDAVYFPHNIGAGAANDEELMYQVGLITADEARLCHMLWNFSPVVAQSVDPRWGRTYESYGSDLDLITRLSTAYTRGLIDGGLIACTKHFLADGNVLYGTGEGDMLIDRGDAQLTDEQIDELLAVYQAQIDAGVQTIMISHSSLNGVKMHENGEYIMKLKNEMGFEGFIVSDWNSVQNTGGATYEEQVINGINAGIDMLMEIDRFEEARQIIVEAVNSGDISEERVNDAVTRIIKVKMDAGLFDDPLCEDLETVQTETGSMEYRAVAEQLVEESLVLLKNDNDILPLQEGTKVYITGPAADNPQVQCGGWTISWNSSPTREIEGVTSIQEAFEWYGEEYGIEVITDPEKASEADVVLLCVGEQSYAEWNGDTEDLELCGSLGLDGNSEAIEEAESLGKPVVTLIVAGRHVILDPADVNDWDSVVMCYLPGSEGKGISDVLCGCADFTGRLPSPWYGSLDQIGTDECAYEIGYGLSYPEGFTPRIEPEALDEEPESHEPSRVEVFSEGTDFAPGLFKDNVYVNEFAGIVLNVPGDFSSEDVDMINQQMAADNEYEQNETVRDLYSAVILDAYLDNETTSVQIMFFNANMYIDPSITAEDILSIDNELTESTISEAGFEYTYSGTETVNINGEDYLSDTYTVYAYGMEFHDSNYLREIDDGIFCFIYVSTLDPALTTEAFESWFMDS